MNCPMCKKPLEFEEKLSKRTLWFCKGCPINYRQGMENETNEFSYYTFETSDFRCVGPNQHHGLVIRGSGFTKDVYINVVKIDFSDLDQLKQKIKIWMTFS